MDALTAAFLRYRSAGDLAALGAVFDNAAGRLFALAVHLSGNVADAEDLVQQTFVLAMQRAATFDAVRPVEPWLAGLLANLANNARRRAAVRRAEPLPDLPELPDLADAGDGGGPIAAAERSELLVMLRAHVDALPAEQRSVLLLRLQHGLGPAEIAEVLQVAPGTVRMRLHRGLQALRRALPAGLAVLLSGLVADRGLAAVRESVLAAGRGIAAGASAAAGGAAGTGTLARVGTEANAGGVGAAGGLATGVLLMKKAGLGVALLAVLAVVWFVNRGAPPLPAPKAPPRGAAVGSAAAAHAGPGDDARVAQDAGSARSEVVAATGTLRVRVVAVERDGDGNEVARLPVGGVLLNVWPGEAELAPYGDPTRVVRTEDQGEVVLADAAPGPWRACVPADEADESRPAHQGVVAPGETAEIVLERNVRALLRGVVVGPEGLPVAGATIWVHRSRSMGRYSRPEPSLWTTRRAGVSGDRGRFVIAIGTREHTIGATAAGFGASFGHGIDGRRDEEVRLELTRHGGAVHGTVRDETGRAVEGCTVTIYPAGQDSRRAADGRLFAPRVPVLAVTDAQGAFRCEGLPVGKAKWTVTGSCLASNGGEIDVVPAMATTLDVLAQRGVLFQGTVRLADGSPARVFLALRPSLDDTGHFTHCDTREDGSYELYPAFPLRAYAVTIGRGGQRLAAREFPSPSPGIVQCDFVLADRGAVRGTVVDEAGVPLAGWRVRATHEGGATAVDTDRTGAFRLVVPLDATLRVEAGLPGRDFEPLVALDGVRVAHGECVLRVPRAKLPVPPRGEVRGRLLAHGEARAGVRVALLCAVEAPEAILQSTTDSHGAFAFTGVPAGRWQVVLSEPPKRPPLATFDLGRDAVVDLGALAPEPLALLRIPVLRVDGAPWRGPLPWPRVRDAAGASPGGESRAEQNVLLLALPAGRYTVELTGVDLIAAPLTVELAAGATVEHPVRVAIGRSRSLVCNGDGEQRPQREDALRCVVRRRDGTVVLAEQSAQPDWSLRGHYYWSCDAVLPFGDYEFEARSDGGLVYRAAFTVREDVDDPTRIDVPRVDR